MRFSGFIENTPLEEEILFGERFFIKREDRCLGEDGHDGALRGLIPHLAMVEATQVIAQFPHDSSLPSAVAHACALLGKQAILYAQLPPSWKRSAPMPPSWALAAKLGARCLALPPSSRLYDLRRDRYPEAYLLPDFIKEQAIAVSDQCWILPERPGTIVCSVRTGATLVGIWRVAARTGMHVCAILPAAMIPKIRTRLQRRSPRGVSLAPLHYLPALEVEEDSAIDPPITLAREDALAWATFIEQYPRLEALPRPFCFWLTASA